MDPTAAPDRELCLPDMPGRRTNRSAEPDGAAAPSPAQAAPLPMRQLRQQADRAFERLYQDTAATLAELAQAARSADPNGAMAAALVGQRLVRRAMTRDQLQAGIDLLQEVAAHNRGERAGEWAALSLCRVRRDDWHRLVVAYGERTETIDTQPEADECELQCAATITSSERCRPARPWSISCTLPC
jgi:hypothetical protein